MSKNLKQYIILCLILLLTVKASGQSFEDALQDLFESYELMGMSLCVEVNQQSECFHFGLRDFERDLPVNAQTRFRIASISKSFTALGLIKLYDQGLFDLDDDISDHLGFTIRNPGFPDLPITFRMLLSHTSSLQDGSGYPVFLNATYTQQPIPAIAELLLPGGAFYTTNIYRQEPPGSYFAYSNLNYGLIGTLIEAISGQRFDNYMRNEILIPLGIDGSFNIQNVPDINDIAVLYRNNGGWQPQFDNFQGVYPPPPDLSTYVPGTNGLYFSPQGGLRASAAEVNLFAKFLSTNGMGSDLSIDPMAISEMTSIQWDYNGSNGDNYFGLFNRWGLGLHHANINPSDRICIEGTDEAFLGHPGEAYGLISDVYFLESGDLSFSFLINGSWPGYQVGNDTSFYTVEEAIFLEICNFFSLLETGMPTTVRWSVWPVPAKDLINIKGLADAPTGYRIYAPDGRTLLSATLQPGQNEINIQPLQPGAYLLEIKQQGNTSSLKLIKR